MVEARDAATPQDEAAAHDEATRADEAPSEDGAAIWLLALRDLGLALAALSLWAAADAWYGQSGLAFAYGLSVLDGLVVGAAATHLAHEWGHFASARWAGAIAPTTSLRSLFPLFQFDMERNGDAAFRAMGIGGNVAHWTAVLLLFLALDLDTPGQVALVGGAFGNAIFASVTEVPVLRRSYAGEAPVQALSVLTLDIVRRNAWIGGLSALGFLLFF